MNLCDLFGCVSAVGLSSPFFPWARAASFWLIHIFGLFRLFFCFAFCLLPFSFYFLFSIFLFPFLEPLLIASCSGWPKRADTLHDQALRWRCSLRNWRVDAKEQRHTQWRRQQTHGDLHEHIDCWTFRGMKKNPRRTHVFMKRKLFPFKETKYTNLYMEYKFHEQNPPTLSRNTFF